MKPVSYAFVWKEEQEVLARFAEKVPENGVIVEIGTARGGTSMIFHQALRNKGIRIYTIDALNCARAKENLKNTDVTIINMTSLEFAEVWKKEINKPVDFLYIDGDHNFCGIYDDYNAWFPFLNKNGTVAFHDYDPVERGGLAHFGVRICLDTLVEKGLLKDVSHEYKLLSGNKRNDDLTALDWKDCFETFLNIAHKVNHKRDEIFKGSIKSGVEILQSRSMQFDSVEACYCIEHALINDFEYLDALTSSFYDFRRWAEMLSVLDHAHGRSHFPLNCKNIPVPENYLSLSRLIAHEQLRISILGLILRTIVKWEP